MADPTPTTPPTQEPVVTEPVTPPVETTPVVPAEPAPATPSEPVPPVTPPADTPPVKPTEPPTEPPAEPTEPPADPAERVVPAADRYTLPEGVPPEVGVFAHENGYTQEQLDAGIKHFSALNAQEDVGRRLAVAELGKAQLKEWGSEAEYNVSLAKRALKQNDPKGELATVLQDSGFGNHPAVLTFLHRLGSSMQEGGFLKSAINKPSGKKSLAQAMYPDMPSAENK